MVDEYKEPQGFVKKESYIFSKTLLEPVHVVVTEKKISNYFHMLCAIPTQNMAQASDWLHLGAEDKWYKANTKHSESVKGLISEIEASMPTISQNLKKVIEQMEMTKNGAP